MDELRYGGLFYIFSYVRFLKRFQFVEDIFIGKLLIKSIVSASLKKLEFLTILGPLSRMVTIACS